MDSASVTPSVTGPGYVVQLTLEDLTKTAVFETLGEVPKLVAQKIADTYFQEIIDKLNVNEVVTLIAAAVAQRVAESYKPAEKSA